ncbi:het-domain-containing [Trichoderma cornu-damae]|uniref:Het-domain-containing n=1 Tax=Trichoderma cornu-damae TaxID=654480 RepID=A0A9P8QSX3_9HYPO|nr:het-domain-containing [Trichoderma cornu-damae]
MELCAQCSSISLGALKRDLPAGLASRLGVKEAGMVLLEDGSALAHSAAECRLCALIQEALLRSLQSSADKGYPPATLSLAPDAVVLEPKSDSQGSQFPDPPAGGSHLTGFNVAAAELTTGQLLRAKIRLYTHGQRVWARGPDAGQEDLDLQPVIDKGPRRHDVVGRPQLQGPGVRLLPSGGRRGRYATLSHCWGASGRHPLKTTRSNLQQHLRDIPWASIPKTFQDAITVARNIGLDYVWIDSLCIVQDDHQDWLEESERMGSIYEQAEVTIAASHTPNCWQGFLSPRRPPPPSIEIPGFFSQQGTDAPGVQVFATIRRESAANTFPEFGALNSRAWATQEWLLSRRIVFFTQGAIIWSCKAITQRETGERCYSVSRNIRWKNVVEQYSDRQLTFATDRLVALEGLRVELGKKMSCEYALGVWRESLPDQLLWQVTKRIEGAAIADPLKLPTWTWAHVPCGVRFLTIDGAKNLCESINFGDGDGDGDARRMSLRARAKRVSVTATALDPRRGDAVTEAVIEAIYADMASSHAKSTSSMAQFILDPDGSPVGWTVFDLASEDAASGSILCLALMGSISKRDEQAERRTGTVVSKKLRHYWVLMVRRRSDGRYDRIGVGKTYGLQWWRDAHVGAFDLV